LPAKGRKERFLSFLLIELSIVVAFVGLILSYHLNQDCSTLMREKRDLDNRLSAALSELNLKESELEELRENLQKTISDQQQLKQGDAYHLRDPLYSEAKQFIEEHKGEDLSELIKEAKDKGMRCASVVVLVKNLLSWRAKDGSFASAEGEYDLIGFYTIDNGMVYFEADTGYQVSPVIGKYYTDCVVGQPYLNNFCEIKDVVVIW
jgi:hypothetical protein